MSSEQNKAVISRFTEEILNKGNLSALDDLVAPDYVNYAAGQPMGREAFQSDMVRSMRAAFPDWQITIDDMVAEGDKVMVRSTLRGTHQGEFQGVPPTGKPVAMSIMTLYRLANGKIVEDRPLFDMLALMQQISAVPARA